jgi:hypothetical protein
VRGDGIARDNVYHLLWTLNPLTPGPSPPEYRGRGEKTRNLPTSNGSRIN